MRTYADGSAATHGSKRLVSSEVGGQRYVVNFDYYLPSGQTHVDGFKIDYSGPSPLYTTTDAWTSVIYQTTRSSYTNKWFCLSLYDGASSSFTGANSDTDDVVYIKNLTISRSGAVINLSQSGIGHSQLIDSSGNGLHCVLGGAAQYIFNVPADHREKYIDLAVTGDTSFVLPEGYIISSIVLTSDGVIGGGIDIGTTNGAGEIVTAQTIAGAGTVLCTLVAGANYNTTGADDTIYITDADASGWDAATVAVSVQMERIDLGN